MLRETGIPLGGRIGLLLVAAVLPLATLSGVYAWIAGETAESAELRARYETARVVAGTVESIVEGAGRATDLMLADAESASDPQRCASAAGRLVALVETVSEISILAGGRRICGLARTPEGTRPVQGPALVVPPRSDAAMAISAGGQPAIRIVRAIAGEDGPIGIVDVGLAPIWSRVTSSSSGIGQQRVFILTPSGGVIADPNGVVQTSAISAVLAAVNDTEAKASPVVQINAPGIGFVAIAGVGPTSLRVAVASSAVGVGQSVAAKVALVAGLPLLFLVAAVGIAWFGVDRLVNRWLRQLGRTARLYGEGELSARLGPIPKAPEEFRSLGASFDAMAMRIEARSNDLERALAEKDHFVRELHHRVKNNFQMIASLLTLQRREADPAVEAAIREAHDRVQALASAYRASYADGETGSVPLPSLLIDLVERLRESARLSTRAVAVEVSHDGLTAHLDRAIPFALLMTEILVPIFDRGAGEEETVRIQLGWADEAAGMIRARIVSLGTARPSAPHPLSERLARAYAAQLGATVKRQDDVVEVLLSRNP